MTIDELRVLFENDQKRYIRESREWYEKHKTLKDYKGFEIDYQAYTARIGEIIQRDYNFTDAQTKLIMKRVHEWYHADFSDMCWGAIELAGFSKELIKEVLDGTN